MSSNFSTTTPPVGLKFIVKNINTRKSVTIFGLKINPGISADLFDIPEIDEDAVKTSLTKGELKQKLEDNEIIVTDSTLSLPFIDDVYRSFLITKGLPASTVLAGSSNTIANTLTDLQNLPTTGLTSGTLVYLLSRNAYFKWEPTNTTTADNVEIVGTGTGRWTRLFGITSYLYQAQSNWYINSVSGNDENDGLTSGTALKTAKELKYRIGGRTFGFRNIFIAEDLPSTDPLVLEGTFGGAFSITGAKKILASGTFTADGYNETAATNTPPSATDSTRTWTSFVGNHIRVTSGAANNRLTIILKDNGSGVARTSIWMNPSSLLKDTPPLAGSTYDIIDFVDIGEPVIRNYTPSNNNDAVFVDCKMRMSTGKTGENISILAPCRIYGSLFFMSKAQTITAYGLSISGPSNIYTSQTTYLALRVSGIVNAPVINNLVPFDNSILDFRNTIIQGAGMIIGKGLCYIENLGIFDATGVRTILVQETGLLRIRGNLFGTTTATSAVEIFSGSRIHILSSITPTLTGGTRELLADGTTTHIPPLTPSAVVPALATISSWADWVASPFSRVFFSKRGTAITNEDY